jgi:hypothetical protein
MEHIFAINKQKKPKIAAKTKHQTDAIHIPEGVSANNAIPPLNDRTPDPIRFFVIEIVDDHTVAVPPLVSVSQPSAACC